MLKIFSIHTFLMQNLINFYKFCPFAIFVSERKQSSFGVCDECKDF